MYKCQDCGFNAPEHCEHVELQAEVQRLTGIADRANKAMEKHMKHNAALEIAIQEAHRDTDKANLQNGAIRELLEHEVRGCHPCGSDCVPGGVASCAGCDDRYKAVFSVIGNAERRNCSHRWGRWLKSSDREGQEFKRCDGCTILEYRPMTEKRECEHEWIDGGHDDHGPVDFCRKCGIAGRQA